MSSTATVTEHAAASKTSVGSVSADDYESYSYDENGNRTKLRKRDGREFTYYYDDLNRVTAKIVPDNCVSGYACTAPPSNATRDVYYGYNARGLQTYAAFSAPTGVERVDTTYNGFGDPISQTVAMAGVASAARTTMFGYDLDGNRKRVTNPDGTFFMYTFDGLDRTSIVKLGNTTPIATMTYDAQGREWTETRGGVTTTFGYDGVSRLSSLADDLSGTASDLTSTFDYSPASQVTARTKSNTAYGWSGYGNLSRTYATNGLNQYTGTVSTVAGVTGPTASFGYDSNGNLASDGVNSFTYDAENRLVADNQGNTLTYDPQGHLYQIANFSTIETYASAGDQRIVEYDVNGNMTARYVFDPGDDNPLIWYVGSATTAPRSLQGDAQGSIVSVADASGALVGINV